MKVPITGMAWTTALGEDLHDVWDRLLKGETAFAPVPHSARLRNDLAAAVHSPPLDLPPSRRLHAMARPAAERALAAAGQDPADPELRLVVGTSLGAYLEEASERKSMSRWANELAKALGITTAPIAISTACSSGSDAILVGAELIRSGAARCCLCGGVDVLTLSKRLAHSALGTMSPTVLRAFDVKHDGMLLGEGAAFVVLEAAGRAARPLAFLRGVGAANDATGMTVPDSSGVGARLALQRSLADAELGPAEIDVINAHGSGTQLNDASERAAFAELFGRKHGPLVFATKGNFGHSLGATGAIEAIALLLALVSKRVPPIANLDQPDPDFPLPLAFGGPGKCEARFGLSLTLGFGGFDTSLVFEVAQ